MEPLRHLGGSTLTSHEKALLFPPLGNPTLMKVGRAEVAEAPGFAALYEHVRHMELGPLDVPDDLTDWLTATVKTANDASYRFDLHHVHGDDEPLLIDLRHREGIDWVCSAHLSAGRGTRKLAMIIGLDGDGSATIVADGADGVSVLSPGVLLVAPAYLRLKVDVTGSSLRCFATTIHGPAFR